MKSREQFFAVVQAEFDARRDPLDSPAVVAWLQEHPEALEDFADLRLVSLQLAEATPAPSHSSTPWPSAPASLPQRRNWKAIVISAVAAALLLIVLPRWWNDGDVEVQSPSPVVQAETPPPVTQEKPTAQHAVLLSHSASSSRSFIARDIAPANPTSGAVVLRMQSSTHHSKP
jgi:hypothetical protein